MTGLIQKTLRTTAFLLINDRVRDRVRDTTHDRIHSEDVGERFRCCYYRWRVCSDIKWTWLCSNRPSRMTLAVVTGAAGFLAVQRACVPAACCSVLQRVAACCSWFFWRYGVLLCSWSVLQRVAVRCCSALLQCVVECVAARCRVFQRVACCRLCKPRKRRKSTTNWYHGICICVCVHLSIQQHD